MVKESSGGFLSKVVQLVRGPNAPWGDSGSAGAQPLTDKQALKAAIERKRRNDFVRKREFDMLRAIRRREQQNGQDPVARPSFFQSSVPSDGDGREQTIKKIDAIEAQMSTHWWQATPGERPEGASERLQAPPSDLAALDGPAHLQAHLFEGTGNTWGSTVDSSDRTGAVTTLPASEAQWPLPGQPRSPKPLPVSFGDDITEPQPLGSSLPMALEPGALSIARCLQVQGVEEAAVRFANGDDAGAERHLGTALVLAPPGPAATEVRRLLLDLFRATDRREAFEMHVTEWAREFGDPPLAWAGTAPEVGVATPAPAVWTCPPVLDVAAVEGLARAGADPAVPLVMDWSALASADAGAAQRLLEVFEPWVAQPMSLVLVGSATLRRSLRASTPSGRRENNPVWWRLRLAMLQLMGRSDEFDLAALDFCVTYGVTPPEWTLPRCALRELEQAPAGAHSWQAPLPAPSPEAPPAGTLQGALQGDVTRSLNAIALPGQAGTAVALDCEAVTRTDFVAAGALLQWALALKDAGRPVSLRGVHGLLAVFFHIVGIADVAEVVPRRP
jgi:anti-anti-sigma regulatory factor